MRLRNYKLGSTPLKIIEDTTMLKTDKCVITAHKDMLALPLTFNEKIRGLFMCGKGRLVIDTIIETSKGAIGKPTEKELVKPFIMIGGTAEVEEKMSEADSSSLSVMGYESLEAFRRQAEEICERILDGKVNRTNINGTQTCMFFFLIDENSYDTLISKNARKLVYLSNGKVYVFGDDKSLMTGPNEILLSKRGKTVIIANNNVFVEK